MWTGNHVRVPHTSLASHAPGMGQRQNIGLRDFCHILTYLLPGTSVFHNHIFSSLIRLV